MTTDTEKLSHVTILGGGPAGLAIGYYAKKKSVPFTLYEAGEHVGGNARTLEHRGFLFDTGAHRFHDKDPEITKEIKELLGEDLKKVDAPSQIFYNGRFIDFPLSPLNLMRNIGVSMCVRAGFELAASKLRNGKLAENFENFALKNYGRTLAQAFLLDYSQKLWGESCQRLSPRIAGNRMKGLNLKTFVKELLRGSRVKTEHLDGTFYYPTKGIGMIPEELGKFCGEKYIRRNARVTRIFHDENKIQAVEINGKDRVEVDKVASTLPLPLFIKLLDPSPDKEMIDLARTLRFRNIILVALFLNKEFVSRNASVYFPAPNFAFTRVYESKNRSPKMAPKEQTSLVAEIPCSPEDELWRSEDGRLIEMVSSKLVEIGWIRTEQVIDSVVKRISHAYPILEVGFEEKNSRIFRYLSRFANLKFSGRGGQFRYTHIHELLRMGKEMAEEIKTIA